VKPENDHASQQKFAGMMELLQAVQRESLCQAKHLPQSLLHETFHRAN
jgi:hypothetical protein